MKLFLVFESGILKVKAKIYTLFYAAILGIVCSLLLTSAAEFTEPYRNANKKAEEMRNILEALKVPFEKDASSQKLVEIFNANIKQQERQGQTIYSYQKDGKPRAHAIRFSGPGLWGPVKGFLALESDMRTIRGITFYQQQETPGLGGEIASAGFRNQFVGKSILDESGKAGIIIRTGADTKINGVDAVTGATMTCDKVQIMLNDAIVNVVGKAY